MDIGYRTIYLSLYIKQKCLSVCPSRLEGGSRGGREGGQKGREQWGRDQWGRGTLQMAMMECQANGMDSHMECLGGRWLQSSLTDGHFVYSCKAGYPS